MQFSVDNDSEESAVDINVTPLVDIVFNLLIFFMVSTTFIGVHGISVALPHSKSSNTQSEKRDLNVTINPAGELFLNGKGTSMEGLKREFAGAVGTAESVTLVLRADETVHHGKVVEVMDIAQGAGISKIAIATSPKTE